MKKEESGSPDLKKAISILKSGGVVIFPTDTVYGIGCVYNNTRAVKRIYTIKGRDKSQPFPVLVSEIGQVEKIAEISDYAKDLMKKHWPGGLTIILRVFDLAKAWKSVGFRQPDSDIVKAITKEVGPIIGTSANFHNQPTPKSYNELDPKFTKLADFVIKGECKLGEQSTVVDATVDPPKVLRQGAVRI